MVIEFHFLKNPHFDAPSITYFPFLWGSKQAVLKISKTAIANGQFHIQQRDCASLYRLAEFTAWFARPQTVSACRPQTVRPQSMAPRQNEQRKTFPRMILVPGVYNESIRSSFYRPIKLQTRSGETLQSKTVETPWKISVPSKDSC